MAIRKAVARFMAVFAAITVFGIIRVSASHGELIAAGIPLGVKFHTDGVVITGIRPVGESDTSPAITAGLRRGDVITGIGDAEIDDAVSLCDAVKASDGKAVTVRFLRAGKEMNVKLSASKDSDGQLRLGLWVRDGASGIGTVTFIDPDSMTFAGLGHGICDVESGALLPLLYGSVEDVTLTGITPGKAGVPGELHGYFSGKQNGSLTGNTTSGVTGVLSSIPDEIKGELYKTGKKSELKEGEAFIFTTVDGGGRKKYSVEISKIDIGGAQKNFTVKITDPELLSKTGGIVQGMSGSPIIQDGKLVGAVTHVLVSDSAQGYGIFIENMISARQINAAAGIAA